MAQPPQPGKKMRFNSSNKSTSRDRRRRLRRSGMKRAMIDRVVMPRFNYQITTEPPQPPADAGRNEPRGPHPQYVRPRRPRSVKRGHNPRPADGHIDVTAIRAAPRPAFYRNESVSCRSTTLP